MSRESFNAKGPTGAIAHIGALRLPIAAVAWGMSLALHGGVLTTWYVAVYAPRSTIVPEIRLTEGEQAVRTTITVLPTPPPPIETASASQVLPSTPAVETPIEIPVIDAVEADPAPALVEILITSPEAAQPTTEPPPPESEPASAPAEEATPTTSATIDQEAETPPPKEPPPPAKPTPEIEEQPADPPPQNEAEPATAATPGVETGAEIVDLPTPKYPRLSRKRGEKGLVVLEVEVLPDGSVGDVKIVTDPGFRRLTRAAIEAVRKARFKPATRDDEPVRSTIRIPLRFVLKR